MRLYTDTKLAADALAHALTTFPVKAEEAPARYAHAALWIIAGSIILLGLGTIAHNLRAERERYDLGDTRNGGD